MRNFQKKNEKSKRQPINIDSDFNDLLTAAPMTEKEKYLHESYLNSKYYEKVCKISNKNLFFAACNEHGDIGIPKGLVIF